MWPGMAEGRFSRRGCPGWSAGCGLEVEDLLGDGDGELGEQVPGGCSGGGDLLEGAGGGSEGADVEAGELAASGRRGDAGGGLVGGDKQRGQPGQDDVGT